jgi:hypothetical protein
MMQASFSGCFHLNVWQNLAKELQIIAKLERHIAYLVVITKNSIVKAISKPPPPMPATLLIAPTRVRTMTPPISRGYNGSKPLCTHLED